MKRPVLSDLARLPRHGLALLLLCLSFAAGAQPDPPSRVAYLGAQQGTMSFSPAGDDSWYDLVPNRPLTSGDRLWNDRGARSELQTGPTAVRLDEQTLMELSELGDQTLRLTLRQGVAQLRVRDETAGERIEVDTANLALVIQSPGRYRIDADAAAGTTRVAVDAGSARVYGENGGSQPLAAGQQLAVAGRHLEAAASAPLAQGDFERWVAERDRIEDQSVSARYLSREVAGYQQLDSYGDWQNDAIYGAVWYPRNVDADWAPYREGGWIDVAPWGWTWIDSAPWGFAPSHYGRWARLGPRWAWVPGPRVARPVYAPALVGFIGSAQATLPLGGGRRGIGWFPLAPGEAWRPGYRASQRYLDQVNRMAVRTNLAVASNDVPFHQRHPEAVTVVPGDVFGRRWIGRRDTVRLPANTLVAVPVTATPPVTPSHFAPGIGSTAAFGFLQRPAAALPPADFQGRPQWTVGPHLRPLPQPPTEVLRQQQEWQQRAAQQQIQQAAQLQQQQAVRLHEAQQRTLQQQRQRQQALYQMQEVQQRAAQQQMQQVQMQAAQRQQFAAQAQMLQAQQLNAMHQAQQAAQARAAQMQPGHFPAPAQLQRSMQSGERHGAFR